MKAPATGRGDPRAEDRTGFLEDPFGHHWWLAQHLQDLTPEEIRKNAEAHFAQFQPASR